MPAMLSAREARLATTATMLTRPKWAAAGIIAWRLPMVTTNAAGTATPISASRTTVRVRDMYRAIGAARRGLSGKVVLTTT